MGKSDEIFIKIWGGDEENLAHHKKFNDPFTTDVFKAMEEYGKYCAKKVWNKNRQYETFFEEWWNNFIKDENGNRKQI